MQYNNEVMQKIMREDVQQYKEKRDEMDEIERSLDSIADDLNRAEKYIREREQYGRGTSEVPYKNELKYKSNEDVVQIIERYFQTRKELTEMEREFKSFRLKPGD